MNIRETGQFYDDCPSVAILDQSNDNSVLHEYTDSEIKSMIYVIRGQQVMLDFDLAKLFGYEVKKFNQQVKRNIERFPDDFMFQMTGNEINVLRSQFVTPSQKNLFKGQNGGRRYMPYVFTEQGVNQLATILRGPIAVKQSIHIMRVFSRIRHYIIQNQQFLNNVDILEIGNRLSKHEESIYRIEKCMATQDDIQYIMNHFIVNDKVKEFVFFKGEQFEADELFIKLYKEAKNTIYIIDNYISIRTLSHLKHKSKDIEVIIFTENLGGKDKLRKAEFDSFNLQYPSLILKHNHQSHDRYIIVDYNTENEEIYHSGSSIKDAGKKTCTINRLDDIQIFHPMIELLLNGDDYIL